MTLKITDVIIDIYIWQWWHWRLAAPVHIQDVAKALPVSEKRLQLLAKHWLMSSQRADDVDSDDNDDYDDDDDDDEDENCNWLQKDWTTSHWLWWGGLDILTNWVFSTNWMTNWRRNDEKVERKLISTYISK